MRAWVVGKKTGGGLSENIQDLQQPAKTRYLEKLDLIGLGEKDDPYSESNNHTFGESRVFGQMWNMDIYWDILLEGLDCI